MNTHDKLQMAWIIQEMMNTPMHNKITMGQELLKFLINIDRGKKKT